METTQQRVKLLPNTGEKNSTVFALGATGSGKTTLIANLLLERERFLVFDTKSDYDVSFFPGGVICNDYSVMVDCFNSGKKRIIMDLSNIRTTDEQEEKLSECLLFAYNFQLANKDNKQLAPLTIALDELNKFITGQNTCEGLELIIQQGRGIKIQKIFGAQWFGDIPTWVRDSFTEIYAFAHFDPAGLNRLETYGFQVEEIAMLEDYHCIHGMKNKFKHVALVAA